MRWYTPDNHKSALETKEKIMTSMEKELEAGRMFGLFKHEEVAKFFPFFRTSPMGATVNADGLVRPINNLSFPRNDKNLPSVNLFVHKEDFSTTWDDFNKVAKFFKEIIWPVHLALFDWEKAYRQILTRMDQWPYLMVTYS
jgi:dihydroorotase